MEEGDSYVVAKGRREESGNPLRSRKGFGYTVRKARAVRDLLGNEIFAEAVLQFWGNTGAVGGGPR